MSTAILRHHAITLSFLTGRRERQFDHSLKTLRVRASRRRLKQVIRQVVASSMERLNHPSKI